MKFTEIDSATSIYMIDETTGATTMQDPLDPTKIQALVVLAGVSVLGSGFGSKFDAQEFARHSIEFLLRPRA